MKKFNFIAVVFCMPLLHSAAFAQDTQIKDLQKAALAAPKVANTDTSGKNWKLGGTYGVNLSQSSLSNWAAGGDNFSLAINSALNLFAAYKKNKHSWDNSVDFNMAYVKTTTLGTRKNDDRLDLLSKYGYALKPKLNLTLLGSLRTQVAKGYSYPSNVKTFSSNFFAPAFILLSPGLDYKPNKNFSFFVSPLTARWVIVTDNSLSAAGAYGVKAGKNSKYEMGAFASVNYMQVFNKYITYKSRLDLFSNYKKNPQNVDLFFTNVINFSISKILTATYSIDMIYDDDTRIFGKNGDNAALQVKSLIGLGLLIKI